MFQWCPIRIRIFFHKYLENIYYKYNRIPCVSWLEFGEASRNSVYQAEVYHVRESELIIVWKSRWLELDDQADEDYGNFS